MPRKTDNYKVKIEKTEIIDGRRNILVLLSAPEEEFTFPDAFSSRKLIPTLADCLRNGLSEYIENGETALTQAESAIRVNTSDNSGTGKSKRGRKPRSQDAASF